MTVPTAALVFGFILGVMTAGGVLRAHRRPFTVRLLDGVGPPTVLVELPDDYDARDPWLARRLAQAVTEELADTYGLPLGVTQPRPDPALVDDVDLASPAQVTRALAAHQRGDATFAIPFVEDERNIGSLTWHPKATRAAPASTVKVVVTPTDELGRLRLIELGIRTGRPDMLIVVTMEDAFRHAGADYRPGELDFIAGAHPDVVAYMRSRIRIPRDT